MLYNSTLAKYNYFFLAKGMTKEDLLADDSIPKKKHSHPSSNLNKEAVRYDLLKTEGYIAELLVSD